MDNGGKISVINPDYQKWIIRALLALIAWGAIGAIVLALMGQGVSGHVGDVWNAVDRADQLIPRLEAQLKYTTQQQKQTIDDITTARNNFLAARKAGDLTAAANALSKGQIAIQAVQENYPSFGITEVEKGLLDETAGSFNRIAYERHLLIQAQTGYNQMRIIFFPTMIFFPEMKILGSDQNPAQQVTPSSLNQ